MSMIPLDSPAAGAVGWVTVPTWVQVDARSNRQILALLASSWSIRLPCPTSRLSGARNPTPGSITLNVGVAARRRCELFSQKALRNDRQLVDDRRVVLVEDHLEDPAVRVEVRHRVDGGPDQATRWRDPP